MALAPAGSDPINPRGHRGHRQDSWCCDAVLFEGGAFADFLAVRGSLLPDDERLLAEQWLLAQRSVHEVVSRSGAATA